MNGACGGALCKPDGQTCAANDQCCGGTCTGGKCGTGTCTGKVTCNQFFFVGGHKYSEVCGGAKKILDNMVGCLCLNCICGTDSSKCAATIDSLVVDQDCLDCINTQLMGAGNCAGNASACQSD